MQKQNPSEPPRIINRINNWLVYVDDIILVVVGIGIVGVAVLLLIEVISDFVYFTQHSIPHIISDLMFVLIIMELFRQVQRQLTRHIFSLNPFIFIGVIASVRGLLIMQMKLTMGETEWWGGIVQLGIYAVIVLILVVCYYVYKKVEDKSA
ncbi:MAG: phosphate-starvation-inducible PsiE family protein [Deltaproteobacteria bacterium]|nr:phosphate-starvation-inducible PsiE family protein [Deltaproteobacteria bacterium]